MRLTKLTDLQVQRLPVPTEGQKTYWEGGFGVRVSQGGAKSFVVMYGPKRQLKTLGRYPAMSLKEARQAAHLHLAVKVPSRRTKSLSEARMAYLEDCERRCRAGTVANYRHLLSQLKKERLDQVTRSDIGQNAHAIMAAKIFFNWCVKNDFIDRNPFIGEKVSYGQRSRVLTDSELKLIWQYSDPPFTDHLKLLILTGQRRSQFSEFALTEDAIVFPASVMKGKREHTLPLTPEAKTLLTGLKPFNGWSKAKARMDSKVKLPHWTIHDLRRTFATKHAALGTPVHVIEKLLDHQSGTISGVASIYNRYSYLKEGREALERYEAHIQTITA